MEKLQRDQQSIAWVPLGDNIIGVLACSVTEVISISGSAVKGYTVRFGSSTGKITYTTLEAAKRGGLLIAHHTMVSCLTCVARALSIGKKTAREARRVEKAARRENKQ